MPVFVFRDDEIGHRVDEIERDGYVVTSVVPNPPVGDGVDRYKVFAHRVVDRIETRPA